MKTPFRDRLQHRDLMIMTGATGTELIKRGGVMPGGVNNMVCPEEVVAVHREYQLAGAEIFLTNTFSMNEFYCETHTPEYDWEEINQIAVKMSMENAREGDYICGNMGPVGEFLQPLGMATRDEVFDAFQKQARVLAEGGVDGFALQTFYYLEELALAVEAVRSVSDLPILANIVLTDVGATIMGDTLNAAYERLSPLGIDALGHNCGDIDGFRLGELLEDFNYKGEISLASAVNAGQPKLRDGETVYEMTPEEFARGAVFLRDRGVNVIGGCCGTTKEHIAAVVAALRS